ncbi:hypothetical protein IX51_02570 [uncultured archaeon]|nr:hypothetical protein IX51_02570 [uncultured archaeon]
MSKLELDKLRFTAGNQDILKGIDLNIEDGEFFVFLGPSGCGKTTTLRIIAGLLDPTSGKVMMDGKVVNDISPSRRGIAMVFQDYALYPHKTVFENIAFPLRVAHKKNKYIIKKVRETAQLLRIDHLLKKKPSNISGGERQRVAMARALVKEPKLLLMDEPLSNLDAKLRDIVRFELKRIHKETGVTTIYVTHDQIEAMTLGDRIAVMNRGDIMQTGTPVELFHEPSNDFIASFLGTPAMNIIHSDEVLKALNVKENCYVGIRPRPIHITNDDGDVSFKGTIAGVNMLGNDILTQVSLSGEYIYFFTMYTNAEKLVEGEEIELYVNPSDIYVFNSEGEQVGRLNGIE